MSVGPPRQHGPARWLGANGGPAKRNARLGSLGWIGLAVASAIYVGFIFWACVPLNMDEFVSYQTLAMLSHPHSVENVFCFPNASYYLRILGGLALPLLTYDYIGSLSSLLYSPAYFLWPAPISALLCGIAALFFQAFVLARMFRLRTAPVFCCLLFLLPYSFVHIADTGPVAFQTTSVFVVCYLLQRWIVSRRPTRRLGMMVLAGLMVGFGCWVKPTYFFVSIGLALTAITGFLLALSHRKDERLRRTMEYLVLFVCAAVPTLLIYEARHLDGSPYLPVLDRTFLPSQVVWDGLWQRLHDNVLHFLINPLDATEPCFDFRPELPKWETATGLILVGLILILVVIFPRRMNSRHRREILFNYALFILALVLVATNVYAKSMHHAVLAYPFALMAVARGVQLQRRGLLLKGALFLFIVLYGSLFCRFPMMMETELNNASARAYVIDLHHELNRTYASDSVIACVDWGIYFVQALYGPRSQVVLDLCSTQDNGQLQRAAAIAARLHRDLAVVGFPGNLDLQNRLRAAGLETVARHVPGADNCPWAIWRIPYARLAMLSPVPPGLEKAQPR